MSAELVLQREIKKRTNSLLLIRQICYNHTNYHLSSLYNISAKKRQYPLQNIAAFPLYSSLHVLFIFLVVLLTLVNGSIQQIFFHRCVSGLPGEQRSGITCKVCHPDHEEVLPQAAPSSAERSQHLLLPPARLPHPEPGERPHIRG